MYRARFILLALPLVLTTSSIARSEEPNDDQAWLVELDKVLASRFGALKPDAPLASRPRSSADRRKVRAHERAAARARRGSPDPNLRAALIHSAMRARMAISSGSDPAAIERELQEEREAAEAEAEAAEAAGEGPASQLQGAIRARIAVSYNYRTGDGIPAAHCRHAAGGCERRLYEFSRYLVAAGEKYGVDPWLMAAMAFRESGFNPFAKGAIGEMGILQINPGRRDAREVRFIQDKWYRRRCRREPGACQREIVEHAAALIARCVDRCGGDVVDALGMYNTGRCGGNDRYAKRILNDRVEMRRIVGIEPGGGQS